MWLSIIWVSHLFLVVYNLDMGNCFDVRVALYLPEADTRGRQSTLSEAVLLWGPLTSVWHQSSVTEKKNNSLLTYFPFSFHTVIPPSRGDWCRGEEPSAETLTGASFLLNSLRAVWLPHRFKSSAFDSSAKHLWLYSILHPWYEGSSYLFSVI